MSGLKILHVCPYASGDRDRVIFSRTDKNNQYFIVEPSAFFQGFGKGKLPGLASGAARLRKFVTENAVDLVISDNPRIGLIMAFMIRMSWSKVRHVIWNFNIARKYTGLKLLLSRIALTGNTHIVVFSQYEKDVYSDLFRLDKRRIHFKLYSGPYLDDPRYTRISIEKKNYIVSAGYSGRDYKSLFKLAAAMPDTAFVVVTLPKAIKDLVKPDNVTIVSGIEELEYCQIIANAQAFVLPIQKDVIANGQIAIVQAMSFNTLLFVNRLPGVVDYFEGGRNLIELDLANIEKAALIVRAALSSKQQMAETVANARSFAGAHFTVAKDIELVERIAGI